METALSLLRCLDTKLFQLVELNLVDSLEMFDHPVDTQGEKFSTVTDDIFQDAELFESVQLNIGDGLEMAGHFVVTWGHLAEHHHFDS